MLATTMHVAVKSEMDFAPGEEEPERTGEEVGKARTQVNARSARAGALGVIEYGAKATSDLCAAQPPPTKLSS
jgi:hypothetical protein